MWRDFERVRRSSQFNMFDPRARQATGLSEENYRFVIQYFSQLKKAVEAQHRA
jgi:hypothetical protein